MFEDILDNLKRKGLLKAGAVMMVDREFCYYHECCFKKVVPVILLKENMSLSKLLSMISTPLTYFIENKIK
ncbi:hypothetical protein [Archaeoglobus sulfaticallidus]|uniref:hypothetical protein n=1 Tax=Archaeoglobus sulfaticallidus TaxID=1316941 RepID=UPI001181A28C|nr:hypothetical protein [Archaeoglobus sulfaticallidus]